MSDWVDLAVAGMFERQAERDKEAAANAAELAETEQQTPEEKRQADREALAAAELARAEKIAAGAQARIQSAAAGRRPMNDWEQQVAGQALGTGWDTWEGPR